MVVDESTTEIVNPFAGEGCINLIPYFYYSSSQGTWSLTKDVNRFLNHLINNAGVGVNGDNIHYNVYLAKGTYTLKTVFTKAANQGIIKVYIGGILIQTIDTYDPGAVYNFMTTTNSIVISSSGIIDIELVIDGKNGASGGHGMYFEGACLIRTA